MYLLLVFVIMSWIPMDSARKVDPLRMRLCLECFDKFSLFSENEAMALSIEAGENAYLELDLVSGRATTGRP